MVKWSIGGIWGGADAEKCYSEIETLQDRTPQNVLDLARNENSELHKCFEWDDSKAAESYRLQQARNVIQHLVIKFDEPTPEKSVAIRVYQISSVKNTYQPREFFIKHVDEYQKLLERAKAELQAFKNRYESIAELEDVINAINNLA